MSTKNPAIRRAKDLRYRLKHPEKKQIRSAKNKRSRDNRQASTLEKASEKHQRWTDVESAYISANQGTKTDREMAGVLGRTMYSVGSQRRKLNRREKE